MTDLFKGLLAPIIVFAILIGIGWVVIDQTTESAAILDQSVSAVAAPADVATADPFADDAAAPAEGQMQAYLDDIAAGLFKWVTIVSGAGLVCALAWFGLSQRLQSGVVAPAEQFRAFPAWVICLIAYAGICGAAYLQFIDPLGIDETMKATSFWAFIGGAAVLGLGAYWVATALAASPVMKPSVPFAAREARS